MSRERDTAARARAFVARPEPALRRRLEGLAVLAVVQVFFGLFPLFVKLAVDAGEGFSPRALAAWRIAVGSAVLGGLALVRHGRAGLPRRSDLARFFLCSLLGIAANQLLALEGVARTSAIHAGLLMTLIPIFTYAIAILARQERLRARRASGIAVALAGALVLLAARAAFAPSQAPNPRLGNALIVLNTLAYAGHLVLARDLLGRYRPLVVIAWSFALSLWATPLLALGEELWPPELAASALAGFAGLLLLPTVAAYLLNTFALSRVAASTAASFIYLQPLVSGAAGMLVLGEQLGPPAVAAAVLLFAGISLVLRGEREASAARRAASA